MLQEPQTVREIILKLYLGSGRQKCHDEGALSVTGRQVEDKWYRQLEGSVDLQLVGSSRRSRVTDVWMGAKHVFPIYSRRWLRSKAWGTPAFKAEREH